jgi:predicted small integral membrane protein
MLIIRYTKIAMAACLAAFCLLVAFDNITDYGTNYLFVQHVMSMDTTYPGNALMYRAVTNPVLWNLVYKLIIIAEALTGILFLAGAICLFQLRRAPARAFNEGKALVVAGGLSPSFCGSSASWSSLASGSPCGSPPPGMGRTPRSGSASQCWQC